MSLKGRRRHSSSVERKHLSVNLILNPPCPDRELDHVICSCGGVVGVGFLPQSSAIPTTHIYVHGASRSSLIGHCSPHYIQVKGISDTSGKADCSEWPQDDAFRHSGLGLITKMDNGAYAQAQVPKRRPSMPVTFKTGTISLCFRFRSLG